MSIGRLTVVDLYPVSMASVYRMACCDTDRYPTQCWQQLSGDW